MSTEKPWFEVLEPEEISFVRRFVLASGSLKEMAADYGVSYPTIRQRLDALIANIRQTSKDKPNTALRRLVRQMVEEGSLDLSDAKRVLAAGAKDIKDLQSRLQPETLHD